MAVRGEGTGRLKPYPRYKEGSSAWAGRIPAHWRVERLKNLASVRLSNVDKKTVEGEVPVELCNYVDVYYNEHLSRSLDFMAATATTEQVRRFSLEVGDVVITKDSESWDDIAVSAVVVERLPGVLCGYHLALVRPTGDVDGAFLARAFSAVGPRDQFRIAANGITRFGLTAEAITTSVFPVPPKDEQRAISTFLDRETAKIDALVAKKEQLLKLLEEKRTALITQAVTKGLDPQVPMVDSGLEWLGRIPAHWAVAPVYSKYEVALGKMLDEKRITRSSLGRYLRNVDVQWDAVNTEDLPEMDFTADDRLRYGLRVGDLVVCEGGEVGRTAIWSAIGEFFYQKAIHRVRPRRDGEWPRFFYYVMFSLAKRGVFVAGGNSNTIDHLTATKLRHYRFPFPPAAEQRAIAAFLDAESLRIDGLIAKVAAAIEGLREYRTALIAGAVTGQIDVREAVA